MLPIAARPHFQSLEAAESRSVDIDRVLPTGANRFVLLGKCYCDEHLLGQPVERKVVLEGPMVRHERTDVGVIAIRQPLPAVCESVVLTCLLAPEIALCLPAAMRTGPLRIVVTLNQAENPWCTVWHHVHIGQTGHRNCYLFLSARGTLQDACVPPQSRTADVDDRDAMGSQVTVDQPGHCRDENGFGVALDNNQAASEEVCPGGVQEAFEEPVVALLKARSAFSEWEGPLLLNQDKVVKTNLRRKVRAVSRENHLDAARSFDPGLGRRRKELHQPELPLRVQVCLWFLHQQQGEAIRVLAEQEKFAGHEEEVARASPYRPLPVPASDSSRS